MSLPSFCVRKALVSHCQETVKDTLKDGAKDDRKDDAKDARKDGAREEANDSTMQAIKGEDTTEGKENSKLLETIMTNSAFKNPDVNNGTVKTMPSKTKKDPAAPKMPLGAYMRFSGQERAKVLSDLGNLGVGETAKELGKRWAALSPETKAKWEDEASKDRETYKEEMKLFRLKNNLGPSKCKELAPKKLKENCNASIAEGDCTISKQDLKAKNKSVNVQKSNSHKKVQKISDIQAAPVADYFAFLFSSWSQVRQEKPRESPSVIQDILWRRWNNQNTEDVPAPVKKKEKKVRDPLAPKRPASSYLLFANSERAKVRISMPELSHREVVAELGRRWSSLPAEEKAPFLAQGAKLMAEYIAAVQARREEVAGQETGLEIGQETGQETGLETGQETGQETR